MPTRARTTFALVCATGLAMIGAAVSRGAERAPPSTLLDAVAGDVEPAVPEPVVADATAAQVTGAGLGSAWDLPNLDHPRIDFWVARFDTVPDMREKFQGFLDRGGRYAPHILERLEARNMPLDLFYLAMIESGFEPHATSHASAVGIWQFISATGTRFGLSIDRAVDERRDPVRATEAALDYLEYLHRRFGSWYLAAAAYNTGEGRVSRIMRQQFGRERARSELDYYRILDRLPRETRDYVPLMIAAARITKDPAAWGFDPIVPQPLEWTEVRVAPATPLAEIATRFGVQMDELRVLNPHFLIDRTPNNRSYSVRLPAGSKERFAE